jgi:hypothetical protein
MCEFAQRFCTIYVGSLLILFACGSHVVRMRFFGQPVPGSLLCLPGSLFWGVEGVEGQEGSVWGPNTTPPPPHKKRKTYAFLHLLPLVITHELFFSDIVFILE